MEDRDYSSQQELTLRDILLGIGAYSRELWRRKWWVVLAAILIGTWFAWEAYRTPVQYRAELTFMLNEEDGGGAALGGVLGQFGLGGGGSEYNLEKVIELSKSRLIIQNVLLDSIEVGGVSDRLGTHLMEVYNLRNKWREMGMETMAEVQLTSDSVSDIGRSGIRVLQSLQRIIISGYDGDPALASLRSDAGTGIFTYRIVSLDEDLSFGLATSLYEHLSAFYINKSTGNQRLTYTRIKNKADSLSQELNAAEYQLALRRDGSLGLNLNRDQVARSQLERKVQILNVMYAEAVRNLAAAEFALSNATPFFATIDRPLLPLGRIRASWSQQLGLGLFLGGFLAAVLVFIRYMFLKVMRGSSGA